MRQVIILLLTGILVSCQTTQTTSENQQNQTSNSKYVTMSKKEKALTFVQAALSQDVATVRELVDEGYIQHNPFIPTGLDAFISLFPVLKENGTSAEAVRVIEDGNFVAIHHLWRGAQPFGAEEMVSFDVLRFGENGKIMEHWDAMMPNTPPNPSGRTLLDGETEISDLDQTAANKAKSEKLFSTFINEDQAAVGAIVTENFQPDYLQHNPKVADGVPAIFEAFGREQWVYQKNHKLIAQGNMVLSISEGTAKGVPTVFYDLLRYEDGKVVEHWDVIQTIPTENLANENTMFAF